MTRRRLSAVQGPSSRGTKLVAEIKKRHPDIPRQVLSGGRYEIMAWFCSITPLPPLSERRAARKTRNKWQVQSDAFLSSYEWRSLRMRVIVKRGARCECCGASPRDGTTVIHVDHIKPRDKFPELVLEESNLQVLCETCNQGKGRWDQTDWRPELFTEAPPAPPPATSPSFQQARVKQHNGTGVIHAVKSDEEMRPRLVKLTPEQIESGKTTAGGWTRKQLAEWGVPWPPPAGWKRKLSSA